MDDVEKQQEREAVDETGVEDVDLLPDAAEGVRGGDTTIASNVIKTQQDTAKNSIGNIRP